MKTLTPNKKRCLVYGIFIAIMALFGSVFGVLISKIMFTESMSHIPIIFITLLPFAIILGFPLGFKYMKNYKIEIHTQTIAQGKSRATLKTSKIIPKRRGIIIVDDQGHKISCTSALFDRETISQLTEMIKCEPVN
jgi:MFS family permease